MGYVTQFAVAVLGNCCPMICQLGARSIIISGRGAAEGSGKESMTRSADGCARRPDETANRAPQSWTVNLCGPVNKGARGAMMAPRTCVDLSTICWWIRSAWCFWWWSQTPMVGTFTQALYDEAKKDGWIVISMKNDWSRIFAFEN